MSSHQPTDVCSMCNQTWKWHQDNFTRHPFTPRGAPERLVDASRENTRDERNKNAQDDSDVIKHTRTPFDPVLRMALIQKGIITPDDLSDAERLLSVLNKNIHDTIKGEDNAG